jgi:hypothetical protein
VEWIVVEREFPEPLTEDDVRQLGTQCFDLYRVTPVRSYLAPDGKRMVCIFRAPDAEAVRTLLRINQSPPGIVWACRVHTP